MPNGCLKQLVEGYFVGPNTKVKLLVICNIPNYYLTLLLLDKLICLFVKSLTNSNHLKKIFFKYNSIY